MTMITSLNHRDGCCHLLVCGEIDAHEAATLGERLRQQILTGGGEPILLEFGNRMFVTSVFIGLLISLQRLARAHGTAIALVRAPRTLVKSLDVLGANGMFQIEESIAAATTRFAKAG